MDTLEPIRKTITVNRSIEEAFKIFTEGISSWWPNHTHSVGEDRVTHSVFETKQGGRVYEVWDDGQQREWAEVLAFEPPHRFVLAWRPNPERAAPTEVEVRFTAEGSSTRVDLEHRGWERLGTDAADARKGYVGGWDLVLGGYVEAAR